MVWLRRAAFAASIVLASLGTALPASAREITVVVVVRSRLARTGFDVLDAAVLALALVVTGTVLFWRGRSDAST